MIRCVIIHGTWGQKSDFAFTDSLFCRSIRAALKNDSEFIRFQWSGANSAKARLEAAYNLRELLVSMNNQSKSPVFIIAHSHGGNIAIDALAQEGELPNVAGIVTLGTPFIHLKQRKILDILDGDIGNLVFGAFVITIAFACPVLFVAAVAGLFESLIFRLSAGIGSSLILFLFIYGLKSATGPIPEMLKAKARNIMEKNKKIKVNCSALTICSKADEAIWWLTRFLSITEIPMMIVSANIVILGVFYGISLLTIMLSLLFLIFRIDSFITVAGPIVMSILMVSTIAVFFFTIICIIIHKALGKLLGTGEAIDLWSNILTKTVVDKKPQDIEGSIRVVDQPIIRVHGGLWHSRYARSGDIVDLIATQINQWRFPVSGIESITRRDHNDSGPGN